MSEKNTLRIGFIPLTDCAPLIVAQEEGFFTEQGLQVELCKEASWSTLRDKLVFGDYQAAHMLAPMLLATSIGASYLKKPLMTAYSFGLNGNAISVSNKLFAELDRLEPNIVINPEKSASVLKEVAQQRQQQGLTKLKFAVVFPFSMHYYLLNHWLKTVGLKVNEDVEIVVVPPSNVVQALEEGLIDGYCVGEPWNTHAVKKKVGVTVITGYEIWNNAPEKVLGVESEWAENNAETHEKLVFALFKASHWIDQTENRDKLKAYLSQSNYINAPQSSIENALQGEVCNPVCETCRSIPNFSLPYKYQANFPWVSHANWILQQMIELRQIAAETDIEALAKRCYRPDIYQKTLAQNGFSTVQVTEKPENRHQEPWILDGFELGEDMMLEFAPN